MKVTFNFHSCFTVELMRHILVFDYFNPIGFSSAKSSGLPKLDNNKSIWFFNSHRHQDHFSKDIFKFLDEYKDVHYVMSDDIWMKNAGYDDIVFVRPDRHYQVEDISIDTLKSTDEGVAFIIETEAKTIYHAGDLHWWYWAANGPEYVKTWGDKYFKEIDKIGNRYLDCAFVLLDPRMEEGTGAGMAEFLKRVPNAPNVFPMHMWGDYGVCREFMESQEGAPFANRFKMINREGQEFNI